MKAISSGLKSASAVIFDKPCWYLGASLITDTGADDKLTIYDSPDATVTNDTEVDYLQASDEVLNEFHSLNHPVWCSKGIYAKLDADTGDYIIWYAL